MLIIYSVLGANWLELSMAGMSLTSETGTTMEQGLTAVLCGVALGAEVRELALPAKSLVWLVLVGRP